MTDPETCVDVSSLPPEDYEKQLPPMKFILRRWEVNNGVAEIHDYIYDIISMETNERLTYEHGIHCTNVILKLRAKF